MPDLQKLFALFALITNCRLWLKATAHSAYLRTKKVICNDVFGALSNYRNFAFVVSGFFTLRATLLRTYFYISLLIAQICFVTRLCFCSIEISQPPSTKFEHSGVQLIVLALLRNQIFVTATFDNSAVFQHHYRVAVANGGKAVRNYKGCAPFH